MGSYTSLIVWSILCSLYVLRSHSALGGEYFAEDDGNRGQNISITCKLSSDCQSSTNNSRCNEVGWCQCEEDTPVFVKTDVVQFCVKDFNATLDGCTYKEQCQFSIKNADCRRNKCVCLKDYDFQEGSQTCKKIERSPLIPIIVGCGLAVTILITLGVYFIRSRAQRGTTYI